MSPILFNAASELAMQRWKARIGDAGLNIGASENLSNVRYADDLMIYSSGM